jgi:hydroxyacylglutathione hydrolase
MQEKSCEPALDFVLSMCYVHGMEITADIHAIPLFPNRAFLITEKKLILIDTGLPFQATRILRSLEKLGKDPRELSLIVLTHHHIDHRGNVRVLKTLTGAKIAAHQYDIPYIEGTRRAYREHPRWWVKLLFFVTDLLFKSAAVAVDTVLTDGDIIQDLLVMHTPGHTRGSISLYHMKKKLLFCGDTAPYILGKLGKPNPYTENPAQEMASLRKLATLDCRSLLPNDCSMVLNEAKGFLKDFCADCARTKAKPIQEE